MGCRLPVGFVGKWSSGANGYIVIDGGWTYPAEASADLPEDLPVQVAEFLPHRRYRVVPVGS